MSIGEIIVLKENYDELMDALRAALNTMTYTRKAHPEITGIWARNDAIKQVTDVLEKLS